MAVGISVLASSMAVPAQAAVPGSSDPDDHSGAPANIAESVHVAAGPRPLFQLPFACGNRVRLATYPEHGDYEIDMEAAEGTPMLASASGVAYSGHSTTGGYQVSIMHDNGWRTLYLHLQAGSYQFTDGQHVEQGQHLANTGNTGTRTSGPHLHYEQQNQINGNWRAVHAWFNGAPSDITDDARHNLYYDTSRNCPGAQREVRQSPGYADVTGDGKADLVAQNPNDTWVMASTGSGFVGAGQWSSVAFHGQVANHIGDVTGDGKADLVAQNETDTWVMASTGSGFVGAGRWSSVPFQGRVANHIGDVTGDGKADLIAQNKDDTWVMTSTGSGFVGAGRWSLVAFEGWVANHIGDVTGDGKADLIAQNKDDTWVMTSTGSSYVGAGQWSSVAFEGSITNLG
jgi:hypothetical protein